MTRARELAKRICVSDANGRHDPEVYDLIEAALSRERSEGFAAGIEAAAGAMEARMTAERLMRDQHRLGGDHEMYMVHGDRAQAFTEAVPAIRALSPRPAPEPGPDVVMETLRNVETFMADRRIGTIRYMEGSDFYCDLEAMLTKVRAAITLAEKS